MARLVVFVDGGYMAKVSATSSTWSGDSDLLPAFEVAQREGVVVCLVHGPRSTYAGDLRSSADERIEMDSDFMDAVRLERTSRR